MTSNEELEEFIKRIERLNDEKFTIQTDIKNVFSEAKSKGYVPKAMRQIIKLRKMHAAEREAEENLIDTYKHALGL